MMPFELASCPDSHPNLLSIFDTTIAPTLLFYSYIPILVISLIFGLFIYRQSRYSLQGKLVLGIAASFSLWVLNILIQWVAVPYAFVHLSWQLSALFEMIFFACALYFALVFVRGRDISIIEKTLLGVPLILVALLLPSDLNVAMFDLTNCESILGPLWHVIYGFEIAVAIGIALFGAKKWYEHGLYTIRGKQISLTLFAVSLLLLVFSLSEIYGEITSTYEFNLLGPVGMVLFLLLIGYTIVTFHSFNIKLASAQGLIFAILGLIASEFFFVTSETVQILVTINFFAASIGGYFLIRSVKREIVARERNEQLAKDLARANTRLRELDRQKSEFVSIASHQLRSPLTAIRGYASMLLEGSYGKLPQKAQDIIERVQESSTFMAMSIEDFLNVSRIEQGRMKYEFADTNVKEMAEKIADELRPTGLKRGLVLLFRSDIAGKGIANVDPGKIRQVIYNLVDNSIKYTQKGTVTVIVTDDKKTKTISIAIKDTGVGMSEETLHNIFDKFVRAKNANSVNVSGTGLGLYVAKQMVESMRGRIVAESEGEGKGSIFTIVLPMVS